jgi:RimJ/RimL family protein N-acetyltransferase
MELTTPRLQIRPIRIDDKEALYKYRSDFETCQYLSLVPENVEDVADFISETSTEINIQGTWFQVVLIEQTYDKVIGDIGLHFLDSDTQNQQVEIGYTLDKEYRGKGYANEALTAVINYLFSHLNKHRIIASVDPTNEGSIKLIERLGFRKEAHFKESLFFHGKWVDDVIYAVLAKEWNSE